MRERRWRVPHQHTTRNKRIRRRELTRIIILDEPRELLAFFILCERLGINMSFLDEPCSEFLRMPKGETVRLRMIGEMGETYGFFVVLAARERRVVSEDPGRRGWIAYSDTSIIPYVPHWDVTADVFFSLYKNGSQSAPHHASKKANAPSSPSYPSSDPSLPSSPPSSSFPSYRASDVSYRLIQTRMIRMRRNLMRRLSGSGDGGDGRVRGHGGRYRGRGVASGNVIYETFDKPSANHENPSTAKTNLLPPSRSSVSRLLRPSPSLSRGLSLSPTLSPSLDLCSSLSLAPSLSRSLYDLSLGESLSLLRSSLRPSLSSRRRRSAYSGERGRGLSSLGLSGWDIVVRRCKMYR
jgi:hypothetical protein